MLRRASETPVKKSLVSQFGTSNLRGLFAFTLCSIGAVLAMFAFASPPAGLGQWTIISSPNTSGTQNNYLTTVSCASATNCWAAGFYYDANNQAKTLLEYESSSGWSIELAPAPTNGPQHLLTAITCVSATNCWGVGYYEDTSLTLIGTVDTLTEHFDGSAWGIVTSPNGQTGTMDSRLWSVSCPAADDCWAVGEYLAPGVFSLTPSSVYQTLIEHNTGSGWVVVSSPNVTIPVGRSDPTGQTDNVLLGVSCASQNDCWAVGWFYNAVGIGQPLTEHYDGTAWSLATSPNIGYSFLQGASCTGTNDCWAVGFYNNASGPLQTLAEHYDGTAWSIVSSPNNPNGQNNELYNVNCNQQCQLLGRRRSVQRLQ